MAGKTSRHSRARGLKLAATSQNYNALKVAPLAGAWIETPNKSKCGKRLNVAPLAGAWIETTASAMTAARYGVAPLAGAWIETLWLIFG